MKIFPTQVVVVTGGGGGGPCPPAFSDSFKLGFKFVDTTVAPTDNATFVINLLQSDSNAGHTEAVQLKFPAGVWDDINPSPTTTNSFTLLCWLSASAGAGSTNPANANGSNNGTLATLQTAVLGTNPIIMTSTLGSNIPTATVTSAIYRGWFRSVNTLITSNGELIMRSTSALFSDIVMFSNSGLSNTVDHLTGTFTFDLVANGIDTLAKLQSCQMIHRVTDLAAGVTPHVMTIDSGAVEISGAFS